MYTFDKDKTSKFKFHASHSGTDWFTLDGINSTVTSADVICNGVNSLMAIGGNTPAFTNSIRTSTETVTQEE